MKIIFFWCMYFSVKPKLSICLWKSLFNFTLSVAHCVFKYAMWRHSHSHIWGCLYKSKNPPGIINVFYHGNVWEMASPPLVFTPLHATFFLPQSQCVRKNFVCYISPSSQWQTRLNTRGRIWTDSSAPSSFATRGFGSIGRSHICTLQIAMHGNRSGQRYERFNI